MTVFIFPNTLCVVGQSWVTKHELFEYRDSDTWDFHSGKSDEGGGVVGEGRGARDWLEC